MFFVGYFPGVRLSFADHLKRLDQAFIKPLKMDLTEGSETSAKLNPTPGKYPKENIRDLRSSGKLPSVDRWLPIFRDNLSIPSKGSGLTV
jgi:hypothetical protein